MGSDSDDEGTIRNVCNLVMGPPNHTGRPKKGHLQFNASFPSGNLGRVDRISDFEYDLFIKPDSMDPMSRFWINFTIQNVQQHQKVILNVVNLGRDCPFFMDALIGLIRSTSRLKWSQIPEQQKFYYRCPHHRMRLLLSFALTFDEESDVYQIALCPPVY